MGELYIHFWSPLQYGLLLGLLTTCC